MKAIRTWWPDHPPLYLGSDFPVENDIFLYNMRGDRSVIYSGRGEWSDRLIKLLRHIPTEYVLYMQEDHWPNHPPPDLYRMMELVKRHDLLRLQLSPVNHYYSLTPGEIHTFNTDSKYLVSHQPSIWKKLFLKECLLPGEDPWKNEYEGTKRLKGSEYIKGRIAIYPCNWYQHKCSKGAIIES